MSFLERIPAAFILSTPLLLEDVDDIFYYNLYIQEISEIFRELIAITKSSLVNQVHISKFFYFVSYTKKLKGDLLDLLEIKNIDLSKSRISDKLSRYRIDISIHKSLYSCDPNGRFKKQDGEYKDFGIAFHVTKSLFE